MIDVEIKYESNTYFNKILKLDDKFSQLEKDQIYQSFLRDIVGNCFFDSPYYTPSQAYFKDNFELIGNLRIRFQRQELKQCDVYVNDRSKNACFEQDSFNLKKDDVGFGKTYQFQKFQTGPTDKGQQFTLKGTYGEYSQEGYMFDFHDTIPREQYRHQIDYLQNVLQDDYYLRVLIITFSLYNPSLDIWVNINLIIERDRFGLLSPYKPKIYFFKPNIYDGSDGTSMLALDIIRLISTLILLLFVLVQIYHNQMGYITSILGFLNVVIIGFSIASLTLSFLSYSVGFKEDELLDISTNYETELAKIDFQTITLDQWISFQNKYFVDLTYVGNLYTSLQSIQSILITILLFRLIFVFSFSIYLKTIVDTIKNAGNDLLKYFVIFLPLLISFAFIFYQIWGAKVQGYNNLTASLCSVILMTIGYMDVDQINKVDSVWSIIYIMLFYLMIIFLLFTFMLGILIESQHGVIMQKGYPSMQKSNITGVLVIQWVFQWIPEKVQNSVRNIIKKLKNESPKAQPSGPESIIEQDSVNNDERKPFLKKLKDND